MGVKVFTFEKGGKSFPIIELRLNDRDKYGISFGLSKARLILENIEAIRAFVEDNNKEA